MQYCGDCVNYQVNALVCHMFCIKIMQLNVILWCLCQLSVQCISLSHVLH